MLRSKAFLLILAVSVLFAVYRNYTFFRKRFRAVTPQVSAAPRSSEPATGRTLEKDGGNRLSRLSAADRLRFAGGLGRDPFVLPGEKTVAGAAGDSKTNRLPLLKAVLWSRGRRVALLNGEILREGEKIYGRKILRIQPDRVILSGGGDGVMIELEKGATP